MTTIQPTLTSGIEVELDRVSRDREALLRTPPSPALAQLIADLFDHEACLWSTLFERTRSRLLWRAALAAEAHARASARWWRFQSAAVPPQVTAGVA